MSKVTDILKTIQIAASEHSPEILTGIGVAGLISTAVLAAKATPKACALLDEAENEKGDDLTKFECLKAGWKPYVPSVISGGFSIACIIGAQSVNAKRNAALATAYKLSEEALSIYKEKVIETIGEKKEKAIEEKVAKEYVKRNPAPNKEVLLIGNGDVLCLDIMSGRYFQSNSQALVIAQNNLNESMLKGACNYISLSEFYDEIGLSHTKVSDQLGWSLQREGLIDIRFDSELTEDGRPCLVVDFGARPDYNFDKLFMGNY